LGKERKTEKRQVSVRRITFTCAVRGRLIPFLGRKEKEDSPQERDRGKRKKKDDDTCIGLKGEAIFYLEEERRHHGK